MDLDGPDVPHRTCVSSSIALFVFIFAFHFIFHCEGLCYCKNHRFSTVATTVLPGPPKNLDSVHHSCISSTPLTLLHHLTLACRLLACGCEVMRKCHWWWVDVRVGCRVQIRCGEQVIRPACPAKSSDSTAHMPISLTPFSALRSSVLTC